MAGFRDAEVPISMVSRSRISPMSTTVRVFAKRGAKRIREGMRISVDLHADSQGHFL